MRIATIAIGFKIFFVNFLYYLLFRGSNMIVYFGAGVCSVVRNCLLCVRLLRFIKYFTCYESKVIDEVFKTADEVKL